MPFRFTTIKGGVRRSYTPPSPPPPPQTALMLDSRSPTAVSTGALPAGQYTVTVTGTVSDWNAALTKGAPEANAQYPTTTSGRRSTQVGLDAETLFAQPGNFSHTLGHWTQFQVNTGSGFAHVEPAGGPHTSPAQGHAYTYHLTSTGRPFSFRWNDAGAYTDNYGQFRITITKG